MRLRAIIARINLSNVTVGNSHLKASDLDEQDYSHRRVLAHAFETIMSQTHNRSHKQSDGRCACPCAVRKSRIFQRLTARFPRRTVGCSCREACPPGRPGAASRLQREHSVSIRLKLNYQLWILIRHSRNKHVKIQKSTSQIAARDSQNINAQKYQTSENAQPHVTISNRHETMTSRAIDASTPARNTETPKRRNAPAFRAHIPTKCSLR
jgi:hypothetical protein